MKRIIATAAAIVTLAGGGVATAGAASAAPSHPGHTRPHHHPNPYLNHCWAVIKGSTRDAVMDAVWDRAIPGAGKVLSVTRTGNDIRVKYLKMVNGKWDVVNDTFELGRIAADIVSEVPGGEALGSASSIAIGCAQAAFVWDYNLGVQTGAWLRGWIQQNDPALAGQLGISTQPKPPRTAALPAPTLDTPADGQNMPLSRPWIFQVNTYPGASGYLFGFFQNGRMVWENNRDEHHLSGTEYTLSSTALSKIKPGHVEVWVRALVNGQWTNAYIMGINAY